MIIEVADYGWGHLTNCDRVFRNEYLVDIVVNIGIKGFFPAAKKLPPV